jgi:hypothetical protein
VPKEVLTDTLVDTVLAFDQAAAADAGDWQIEPAHPTPAGPLIPDAVVLLASVAVTRAFGVRVPARALLAGAAVNGLTHAALDRREPLLWLAARAGKAGYIAHATAVRKPGDTAPELSGPGTALMQLDEAAHRAIGVAAALVTTWLATRAAR